jgi:hypothetical protein
MFSPVKAITAGVVVFALGGILLVSQPFSERGAPPAAEGDPAPVVLVEVSGVTGGAEECDITSSRRSIENGFTADRGYTCTDPSWDMSDPRLDGVVSMVKSLDRYAEGTEDAFSIGSIAVMIENEDGSWHGRPEPQASFPWGSVATNSVTILDGRGAYEGLVAVLDIPDGSGGERGYSFGGGEIRGFITDAGYPAPPEIASDLR